MYFFVSQNKICSLLTTTMHKTVDVIIYIIFFILKNICQSEPPPPMSPPPPPPHTQTQLNDIHERLQNVQYLSKFRNMGLTFFTFQSWVGCVGGRGKKVTLSDQKGKRDMIHPILANCTLGRRHGSFFIRQVTAGQEIRSQAGVHKIGDRRCSIRKRSLCRQ